jgi:glutathione S-transferase
MKLYYSPGVCSMAPHIILREAGLPFEAIRTDIRAKTTEGGGDYWKTNPLGYVPALQLDDGMVLTEGPAIMQYIADKAPTKGLAPANGTIERYRMQSWLNLISSELHKGFTPILSPAISPKISDEARTIFRDRLAMRFAMIDKHLAGQNYLMGAAFTCPDAYLFTVLRWTVPTKIDLAPYPHLRAFMARAEARPAVQATMAAEGLLDKAA